jgi:hypothetical protein
MPRIGILALLAICHIASFLLCGCSPKPSPAQPTSNKPQQLSPMPLTNPQLKDHKFLSDLYDDEYFPDFLVDKCKAVLVELCQNIERIQPMSKEDVLALTHKAVEQINDLQAEFEDNDSEIETGAREALGADFALIVKAYGFEIDAEEVTAGRDW